MGEFDPDTIDRLAEAGGRVAARIRDEVLEEAGPDGSGTLRPGAEAALASSGRRVGLLERFINRLAPSGETSAAAYGREHGMESLSGHEFQAAHLTLPLPGVATEALYGKIPRTDLSGFVVWMETASDFEFLRSFVGIVTDTGRRLALTWVDTEDPAGRRLGPEPVAAVTALADRHGYGVSSAGTTACVYRPGAAERSSWPTRAAIDEMCDRAPEIIAGLPAAEA